MSLPLNITNFIMNKSNFSDEEFVKIVSECQTMALAAKRLGMAYMTFVRRAKKLGCYHPNPGHKGISMKDTYGVEYNSVPLSEILAGKHPSYQTYKLHKRLIKEGYFKDECSICGWNKKPEGAIMTPCELDHINGDPTDHHLENLRLICPNCHSLTPTYRFRRGKTNEAQGRKLLDAIGANSTNSSEDVNFEDNVELN